MSRGIAELWQGCTEQGEFIMERGISKTEAAAGALHITSHVWLWRTSGGAVEVLLQRRSPEVLTWPGLYDISAAGHVEFGDTPLDTALREAHEELGAGLIAKDLRLLFTHRYRIVAAPTDIIENEWAWVYGARLPHENKLEFRDKEVDSTWWLSLPDFRRLCQGSFQGKHMIHHGRAYDTEVIEQIKRVSENKV